MTVDVMEYAWRFPNLNWFVLATGDSDFSPLLRRLREMGKSVIGVGPQGKLSESVKSSCSRYIYTDTVPQQSALDDALLVLSRALASFDGGAHCPALKKRVIELDPAFSECFLGFSGFLAFLRTVDFVAVRQLANGGWFITARHGSRAGDEPAVPRRAAPRAAVVYGGRLRRRGWKSPSKEALLAVLNCARQRRRPGTKQALMEALMEATPGHIQAAEVREAFNVIYKAQLWQASVGLDGTHYQLPPELSDEEALDAIDLALICRAVADEPPELQDLAELLLGDNDPGRVARLVARAEGEVVEAEHG